MAVFEVSEEKVGARIDRLMTDIIQTGSEFSQFNGGVSRSIVKDFVIETIQVNGENVKPSYKIELGDKITYDHLQLTALLELQLENKQLKDEIVGEEGELEIRFENTDYIILNKPHGLVVHPGVGNSTGTLMNRVRYYLESRGEYDPMLHRSGLVHRLDKSVGGLMVIAKSVEMQNHLKQQFESHSTFKIYKATVDRVPIMLEGQESIEDQVSFQKELAEKWVNSDYEEYFDKEWYKAEGYINRSHNNRIQMAFSEVQSHQSDRRALSYLRRVGVSPENHLYIRIVTGRNHQIRATLKYYGSSILGDSMYGEGRAIPESIELNSTILGFKNLELKNEVHVL